MDFLLKYSVFLQFIGDFSFIAMAAYLTGRSRFLMNCARNPFHLLSWLSLTILFSGIVITGAYSGAPGADSLITTRFLGVLLSGLVGGPLVGFSVGLVSAIHLSILDPVHTSTAAISSVLCGAFAGLVRQRQSLYHMNWEMGAVVALAAELLQNALIISFQGQSESIALYLQSIALPTAFLTVAGVSLFLFIVGRSETEQDTYSAKAAFLSLEIARRTLPYLRDGFTPEAAHHTARIVQELTRTAAVAISDREQLIAFVGKGSDHHRPGDPIVSQAVQRAIAEETVLMLNSGEETICPEKDCPLNSGVAAPLFANGTVMGAIQLFRKGMDSVSEVDVRLADGIANLLSVQVQLADSDRQRKMREEAEFKALQAQINPHFLFNTLNIIMSFCRTDPDKARHLLGNLATMMQRSFAHQGDFITLNRELDGVEAYLEIVKARFGNRLTIHWDIDASLLALPIPLLCLQPLVENAVQHGLFPKTDDCILTIAAHSDGDAALITISDNGVGIPEEKRATLLSRQTEGIGMTNVHHRLLSIYGPGYGLHIDSDPPRGTCVSLRIPWTASPAPEPAVQ
ncbi:MAG TPA: histidine kinase [Patescibacteria group bacterium]|nr:histidine kinase [Patescibacteria group bacterium]